MITPAKAREKHGRDPKGRWLKGQSGNPAGTITGSRHRASVVAQELLDGQVETLTKRAIGMALAGDSMALKLCLERLLPRRRECPVTLPGLTESTDALDLAGVIRAERAVLAALGAGELTPSEAAAVMGSLRHHRDSLLAVQGEDEQVVGPIDFTFDRQTTEE